MTCTQAQPLLDAYADRELSRLTAFRIRRHLVGCPACTAQLADIQRLNASVHDWHIVPTPPTLSDRIAVSLPRTAPVPRLRRGLQVARHTALALLCCSAAAGSWLLTKSLEQPAFAFADVQRAMQQVQIVSWRSYIIVTDANWRPLHSQESAGADRIIWLRRDPPAIATIVHPGGLISLIDNRGNIERTAQGNYVKFPPNSVIGINLAKDIKSQIKSLTERPMLPSPASTSNLPGRYTNFQQQSVLLNGQQRILFTFDGEFVVHALLSHGREVIPATYYFTRTSTWVDPTTHLATRIERRQSTHYDYIGKPYPQPSQGMIFVESDFRYNQAPPPGVFDWSPPPGANVINSRDFRVGKGLRLYLPKKKMAK